MSINKDLCQTILEQLEAIYPNADKGNHLECRNHSDFPACSNYLFEHGFIEGQMWQPAGRKPSLVCMRITKAGIDHLASDGGISATLKTITVRFDEERQYCKRQSRILRSSNRGERSSH